MIKLIGNFLRQSLSLALTRLEKASGSDKGRQRKVLILLFQLRKRIDREINRYCDRYYDSRHPKHFLWREHNRYIFDAVRPGERVLDIGCGASQYPQWLAEKAASVTCVDIRPDRVELARSRNTQPNVSYALMDVTRDLPSGQFDVAVCSHVLEHLDDPAFFLRKLGEKVPRVIIKVPLDDSDWMKLVKKDLDLFWMDDTDHRREYSESLLREQLEAGGWQADEVIRGYDLRAQAHSLLINKKAMIEDRKTQHV